MQHMVERQGKMPSAFAFARCSQRSRERERKERDNAVCTIMGCQDKQSMERGTEREKEREKRHVNTAMSSHDMHVTGGTKNQT